MYSRKTFEYSRWTRHEKPSLLIKFLLALSNPKGRLTYPKKKEVNLTRTSSLNLINNHVSFKLQRHARWLVSARYKLQDTRLEFWLPITFGDLPRSASIVLFFVGSKNVPGNLARHLQKLGSKTTNGCNEAIADRKGPRVGAWVEVRFGHFHKQLGLKMSTVDASVASQERASISAHAHHPSLHQVMLG